MKWVNKGIASVGAGCVCAMMVYYGYPLTAILIAFITFLFIWSD